jgi:hypothetical protein
LIAVLLFAPKKSLIKNYLVDPEILVKSMKSIDFNENMGFKSTVF